MAGVVAMRAMFERMGFTVAAASLLTDEQGIDTLMEVRNMEDANIENLCKVLRRPGVRIPRGIQIQASKFLLERRRTSN